MRYGRKRATWRDWLTAVCLLAVGQAAAATQSRIESEVAAVEAAAQSAYEQALTRFDETSKQAPAAAIAVERCEFIQPV